MERLEGGTWTVERCATVDAARRAGKRTPVARTPKRPMKRYAILLLAALQLAAPARTGLSAQETEPSDTIRVGTRVAAPFVLQEGDAYAGLSIALWDHVAERLGHGVRRYGVR